MITRTEIIEEGGADEDLILTTAGDVDNGRGAAKINTTTLYMLGDYQIDVDRYKPNYHKKIHSITVLFLLYVHLVIQPVKNIVLIS